MKRLRDLPIRQKLTLVILATCALVLLLACLAIAAFELVDFRSSMIRDATVLADILGKNSTGALAFKDTNAATQTLQAFQLKPHVVTAGLYSSDGALFAEYARTNGDDPLPQHPESDGHRFKNGSLILFRPVMLNERRIGTIYLQTDMGGMYDRLRLFGVIAVFVLAGSLLLALVLSSRLQRPISRPLLALAETARIVGQKKDYSLRAPKEGQDEIGVLTDDFNQMLARIQEQNHDLQRLAAIVESSDDAIISKTLSGIITSWNHGAKKLFGYTAEETIGKPMLILFPADRVEEEAEILARIGRGENIEHLESVRVAKNGKPIDISATLSPIRDNQDKIIGISTIARDITDRKLAQEKLQAQLARLALMNHITRAIGERQDLHSIFQVVIRSLEDNLPIDFSCICLHDAAAHSLKVIRVGVKSAPTAMELAMSEQADIPIDENGLSRCVRGQLVYEPDIKEVQFPFPQRLLRGGLRSLVAAPLLVESKVFGVLIAARRQARSFSSGECEFLGQLSGHVALAAHQAQLYGALQQAYDDLRQTQQAVMQQERLRALGQMASGIAHDINNAISPVALYVESLLETESNLSPRARNYLETIEHAIDDVAQTVARMREFYRQRETQLTLTPVILNRLVQQVVNLSRARWNDMPQQRGAVIHMETKLASDLPAIMGIESEIREAMINLIFNAVDAMPNGGTLTIRTGVAETAMDSHDPSHPTHIKVEISDTGVGMDEKTRRRCLEPFFTTKGERGTGLGLAMVYGMVKRHSADIEIESVPGQGTTVRLTFAAPASVVVEPGNLEKAYKIPSGLRILVVDDDPMLIKSLRDTLETDGHTVVTSNGGQAGIDIFKADHERNEKFSLVITDLGMPYVDGRQVASAVKKVSPTTPVIMLTGWGQRLAAEGDIPLDVDRVLNKPPKLRELREALAECLRTAGS